MTSPVTVAVLLPCHDEEDTLPAWLDAVLPQLRPGWRVVAVDDSSTDSTGAILDAAAAENPALTVLHGRLGSPGAARSVAAAQVTVLSHDRAPDWLLTTDCDIEIPDDFVEGWARRFAELTADESIGAVNGGEAQAHLLEPYPNAARASSVFGLTAMRSESAVGVTNLNGVNHAVRTSAYLTAGPYIQPTAPTADGPVTLAGEDWDLGVRLRISGYEIAECDVTVRDRGRRLLADLHSYLSGQAYEGAFRRLDSTGPAIDIDAAMADALRSPTIERVLLHFFFKPVLACPSVLDGDIGLTADTVAAMREWMRRWPSPTFLESREGFMHGRLPRFAATFSDAVQTALGLADTSTPEEN